MMRPSETPLRGPIHIRARRFAPLSAPEPPTDSLVERILHHAGADPAFIEALLGDIAEECDHRSKRDGVAAARWWYATQLVRSSPYVAQSWFRYARRHARAQFAAVMAGLVAVSIAILLMIGMRDGPPAVLQAGTSDDIVINSENPVHLPVQVLDARGHLLKTVAIRYERIGGDSIDITPLGVITCTSIADARLRVSLAGLSRTFSIRCRPLRDFYVDNEGDMTQGDPPERLRLVGRSPDGRFIGLIAGSMTVRDTSIAVLDGEFLRPRAVGTTEVVVAAGDRVAYLLVRVWKRRDSPTALQQFEAFSTKLDMSTGETRRLSVARGLYIFSLRDDSDAFDPSVNRDSRPRLVLTSRNANCKEAGDQRYMCVALADAEVIVYAPRIGDPARRYTGRLAIYRLESQ